MDIARWLFKTGLRANMMHGAAFASIVGAIALWFRGSSNHGEKSARAQRLAIFIGLWPATFFQLGKIFQDMEAPPAAQAVGARANSLGDKIDHAGEAVRDRVEQATR